MSPRDGSPSRGALLFEVFRYELAYRARRFTTWLYAPLLMLFALWMMLATAEDAADFHAPERLAGLAALLGLPALLVGAAIFGEAALRPHASRMDALLFTTPQGKTAYLGGRFLAAWAQNALLMLAVPLQSYVFARLVLRAPDAAGSLQPLALVQPFLLVTLPNLALSGALLFAVALRARKALPVYLAAIGLFVAYVVAANLVPRPEGSTLGALLDPFGIGAIQATTRLWTAAERSSRLLGFPPLLLANRALWLCAAALVLALVHRRYRFERPALPKAGRRERRLALASALVPSLTMAVTVPRVSGSFTAATTLAQTLALARQGFAHVARGRAFLAALVAAVALVLLLGWNVGASVFDTSTWPVTHLVAGVVLGERAAPILIVLIALFAGELVWRDRDAGVHELVGAAPVRCGVAVVARLLALFALIVCVHAAYLVGGVLLQALSGYTRFELGLYAKVLFGLELADSVLFAALALCVHVVVNHKYLGHLVVLAVYAFTKAAPLLGIHHYLLRYGSDPGWTYSDMNGFGPFLLGWAWFKAYGAAWALVLCVLATAFWVRGADVSPRARLARARERLLGPLRRVALAALLLVLAVGGIVFANTNVLHRYEPADARGAAQALYERRYRHLAAVPQPRITHARLRIELHPRRRAFEAEGAFTLVNDGRESIDTLYVTVAPHLELRSLALDRDAARIADDAETGFRTFALGRPLAPGDSLRLTFDVGFAPRGFPHDDPWTAVARNGTKLDRRAFPFVGYQPLFEVDDEGARANLGLPPRAGLPDRGDVAALTCRWPLRDADLVHVDAVIGTDAEQTAITPGVLRRSWTEDGRAWFHYETEAPIAFSGTVLSARYAVVEDAWDGVALRIHHQPEHRFALDRLMRGMQATLAYASEHFGRYPDTHLRLVEVPRYGGFGAAHPNVITFTEDAFLSRVEEGEVDLPFYGAAHEVAHSWWGGEVRGALVRGAEFLSESLANYTAMMVTEKTYGEEAARRVYAFQMERYLRGRAAQGGEVPVLDVEDQPFVSYRRGALGLYTLRRRIGEARVNAALRRYFETFSGKGPPYPTSSDLYALLRAETPPEHHALLADLLEKITLWEVRAKDAALETGADGSRTIALTVVARKVYADGDGRETEAAMDELVEIGVHGAAPESGEGFVVAEHRLRSGEQTIRIAAPDAPSHVTLDPHGWLIERERGDNVVGVRSAE